MATTVACEHANALRVKGGGLGSRFSICGSRSLFVLLIFFFLTRTALSFAPGHLWRVKHGALVLRALAGAAYDDGFITTLSSELSLQPATVHALRHNRATELAIVSFSRHELQEFFNITIFEALAISSWSEIKRKEKEEAEQARRKEKEEADQARRKEKEEAERARRKEKEEAEQARRKEKEEEERARRKKEEEAERARRKKEDEEEQARRKQQKLDEAKLVFIFNEFSRKYEKYRFQDQKSLQLFISNERIRGLAVVETVVESRDSPIEVVIDWAQLVNGIYYSVPDKIEDAVKVLMEISAKDEMK